MVEGMTSSYLLVWSLILLAHELLIEHASAVSTIQLSQEAQQRMASRHGSGHILVDGARLRAHTSPSLETSHLKKFERRQIASSLVRQIRLHNVSEIDLRLTGIRRR
jgi:hypothetical protein